MTEILINAINHYGADAQTIKAVEELAELQQALCKSLCARLNPQFSPQSAAAAASVYNNIIEEIADVEIMLQQIRLIFNINENEIENVKNNKLSRLITRIAAGEG